MNFPAWLSDVARAILETPLECGLCHKTITPELLEEKRQIRIACCTPAQVIELGEG